MTYAYVALLLLVALGRLIEIRISRRNQKRLEQQGIRKVSEPHFRWLVVLHSGLLACAAAEVLLLHRPLMPALAIPMGLIFLLANMLRWWVIRSLSGYWNMQVMPPSRSGIVTSGPYRWVRHPNYAAVIAEIISLPMIHTAWITALVGGLGYLEILRRRLQLEEGVLFTNDAYRSAMGHKPRFLPKLF